MKNPESLWCQEGKREYKEACWGAVRGKVAGLFLLFAYQHEFACGRATTSPSSRGRGAGTNENDAWGVCVREIEGPRDEARRRGMENQLWPNSGVHNTGPTVFLLCVTVL